MQVETDKIVANFSRDGFYFPIGVLGKREVNSVRSQIEFVEEKYGKTYNLEDIFRGHAHLVMPVLYDLARHPIITDAVTHLLGPDLLVWNTSIFIKEPKTETFVGLHQDLYYWGLDSNEEVTAWVAITPATLENGCMEFVAGSHKTAVPHFDTCNKNNLLSRRQELKARVKEKDIINVQLKAGQCSLHHGYTFHSSPPNRSEDRRIGFAIRYITPRMRQTQFSHDFAILACGQDKHRNFRLLPRPRGIFAKEEVKRTKAIHEIQNTIYMRDFDP